MTAHLPPCPYCGGPVTVKVKTMYARRGRGVILQYVPRAQCRVCLKKFKNSGAEELNRNSHEPRHRF